MVDTNKIITPDQCVLVQPLEPKPSVTVLSQHAKLVLSPDRVVSKHAQVKQLAGLLAEEFLEKKKSHRVVVNQADKANNIGGFNISNFKTRFLNDYLADVIADYHQSLLGAVLNEINLSSGMVHLSVTKFKGDVGFSLLQGDAVMGETMADIENSPLKEEFPPDEYLMAQSLTPRKQRLPTLPEFKSVKELAEVYSAFTQANLKHRVL